MSHSLIPANIPRLSASNFALCSVNRFVVLRVLSLWAMIRSWSGAAIGNSANPAKADGPSYVKYVAMPPMPQEIRT